MWFLMLVKSSPPNSVNEGSMLLGCPIHSFIYLYRQILILRYLMNGLKNFDKNRGWWPGEILEVRGQGHYWELWIMVLSVAACDWWAEIYLQNEEKWICMLLFLSLFYSFVCCLLFYPRLPVIAWILPNWNSLMCNTQRSY